MAQTKGLKIGDVVIRFLMEETGCIETLTILAANTFVLGQIGCIDNAGKVNTIANAQDDVCTLTMAVGTDSGTFGLRYRGDELTGIAYNVAIATLETALQGLHADLDTCVVATPSGVGVDYTITIPHEKKSNIHHISKGADATMVSAAWEGGITVDRTTDAEQAGVLVLEAVENVADQEAICLVRNAVVDAANVGGQSADINKRLAEFKVADDFENQAGYGNIFVRTGPTYTLLATT